MQDSLPATAFCGVLTPAGARFLTTFGVELQPGPDGEFFAAAVSIGASGATHIAGVVGVEICRRRS